MTSRDHDDASEAGRLLFAKECRFVAGATRVEQLPPPGIAEVAFAGRSNVGKSSLINALTGRKALAIVSTKPGRTRQINFFSLDNRLMLVDLPGYGYARAAKTTVAEWSKLIERYLLGRPVLRRVLMLIDARHGFKDSDRQVFSLLDRAAVSYQVVLTKADTISASDVDELAIRLSGELRRHGAASPEIIATSARENIGIAPLREVLERLSDWRADSSAG